MIKTETFWAQLINSVVNHLTLETADLQIHTAQQFLVRSEILRRYREIRNALPLSLVSEEEKILQATAVLFFDGDTKACTEQWQAATLEDPFGYYEIEMGGLGSIKIHAIDLTTNIRPSL